MKRIAVVIAVALAVLAAAEEDPVAPGKPPDGAELRRPPPDPAKPPKPPDAKAPPTAEQLAAATTRGLAALTKMQGEDGHWGDKFPVAVTSVAALSILASSDDPFADPALWKAYDWLLKQQKNGDFRAEGHTWLHSQGFATLFLAEFYGRALLNKPPPERVKLDELKALVAQAATLVADAQSAEGGWWYHKAAGGHEHEGSTTVCAVQALRAAKNFGIPVSKEVLDRGFAYLKATQCADGGFEYQKGTGTSMVAGTAGALATLVLMSRLDEKVLMDAIGYLGRQQVAGLAADRFPDYALFYVTMAMTVVNEEYGKLKPEAAAWIPAVHEAVVASQREDGTWANIGWMGSQESSSAYATGMYVLTLSGPQGRLSIFHRDAPELPGGK
ncbi:MAG: terpene cyclase/mutase family protein [Candidatus Brocadiae bacterium]|nr:terpene cyclase/mutase family protein [Candidatus Brocadiia bacterium]